MNSPGVEISIAGCVLEMVGDPNPRPFFLLFFFFSFVSFFMCFVLSITGNKDDVQR